MFVLDTAPLVYAGGISSQTEIKQCNKQFRVVRLVHCCYDFQQIHFRWLRFKKFVEIIFCVI